MIGKAGVEATFEDVLRGTYGIEEVERDAPGRVVRTVSGSTSSPVRATRSS